MNRFVGLCHIALNAALLIVGFLFDALRGKADAK
jgi:hypothetical protein